MKIKIHKPVEEYGFVEVEVETDDPTTDDLSRIRSIYDDLTMAFKNGGGLDQKEWIKVFDKYLETNVMESDEYERMSLEQKGVIQEIKKSIKRQNYKLNKNENANN